MKSFWKIAACLMLTSAMAYAQPGPPPDGAPGGPGGDRPAPGQQDGGGPGGPGGGPHRGPGGPGGGPGGGMMPGMPGGGRGQDGPGGGGPGGGGPGGAGMNGPMRQFEVMRGYLEVVDRYTKISTDPTASGIAAVVAAADTLKPRGPDAAIEYFTKLLPEVKNDAVARAIRSQLADLYKASGQQDKALEQLHTLITGAGPSSAPAH